MFCNTIVYEINILMARVGAVDVRQFLFLASVCKASVSFKSWLYAYLTCNYHGVSYLITGWSFSSITRPYYCFNVYTTGHFLWNTCVNLAGIAFTEFCGHIGQGIVNKLASQKMTFLNFTSFRKKQWNKYHYAR